jgi:hypothetical protein
VSKEEQSIPSFRVQSCSNCFQPIRGVRFHCSRGCCVTITPPKVPISETDQTPTPTQQPVVICETCSRNQAHPPNHLKKVDKDCILAASVSTEQGIQICSCQKLQRRIQRSERLYPFRAEDRKLHEPSCGLFRFSIRHCRTKYDELMRLKQLKETIQKGPVRTNTSLPLNISPYWVAQVGASLRRSSTISSVHTVSSKSSDTGHKASSRLGRIRSVRGIIPFPRFKLARGTTSVGSLHGLPRESASVSSGEPSHSENTVASGMKSLKTMFVRPLAQIGSKDIPYGNVHMALMIGPLLFENGIPE